MKKWGEVIITNLYQIKSKYILFLLDDYFLQKTVNTKLMQNIFQKTEEIGAKYVKLTENGLPLINSPSEEAITFLKVQKKDIYGTSLQAAVWNRDFFLNVLKPNETPWDFERNVRDRWGNPDGMYYLDKQPLDIKFGGVMHHGRMDRQFAKKIAQEGIEIDRKYLMTRRQLAVKFIEDMIYTFDLHVPIPKSIKAFLKSFFGYKY